MTSGEVTRSASPHSHPVTSVQDTEPTALAGQIHHLAVAHGAHGCEVVQPVGDTRTVALAVRSVVEAVRSKVAAGRSARRNLVGSSLTCRKFHVMPAAEVESQSNSRSDSKINFPPTLSVGASIGSNVGAVRLEVATVRCTIGDGPVLLGHGSGGQAAHASVAGRILVRHVSDTHPPAIHEVTVGQGNPVLASLERDQDIVVIQGISAEIPSRDDLDVIVNVDEVDNGHRHRLDAVHVDTVLAAVDGDLREGTC